MTSRPQSKAQIRFFDHSTDTIQEETLSLLKRISSLGSATEAVVALPDMHHKPKLEAPSSLATAMRDHIVFGLSSPSPNCGMAFVRTNLNSNDIGITALDTLFKSLAQKFPIKHQTPDLSKSELLHYMLVGARGAVKQYGLDPNTILHMDQLGNAIQDESINTNQLLETIPKDLLDFGVQE